MDKGSGSSVRHKIPVFLASDHRAVFFEFGPKVWSFLVHQVRGQHRRSPILRAQGCGGISHDEPIPVSGNLTSFGGPQVLDIGSGWPFHVDEVRTRRTRSRKRAVSVVEGDSHRAVTRLQLTPLMISSWREIAIGRSPGNDDIISGIAFGTRSVFESTWTHMNTTKVVR